MESESIDNEMFQRNELMKKLEIETDQVVLVSGSCACHVLLVNRGNCLVRAGLDVDSPDKSNTYNALISFGPLFVSLAFQNGHYV